MIWNRRQREIYQVTGGDNWALYWVGHYIAQSLNEGHPVKAHMTQDPWKLRRQVIQFVDRYVYLHGTFRGLHPSNTVFLTWYHGEVNDPNPDMQQIFALLPKALPYLEKIVVSCTISAQALIRYGIPPEQLVTIPIGVDLARFKPPKDPEARNAAREKFGIPPEAIVVGSFQKDGQGWGDGMTPKPIKGPDILLDALAALKKQVPELMVFLTGAARGYVMHGLEQRGIPYVHRLLKEYHDIVECYHALDLYMITSRAEGGPKGLMESWATGVPVVSTHVGMPADYIRPGENGLLAPVGDGEALAREALRFIEDPDLRARNAQQGLADVRVLGWDVISDSYYQLYKPYL
jgi:glycosyltransferase involved in cell wall biosynthesis